MRVEQEQKVTEDARIFAEQDASAQRHVAHVLKVLSHLCYAFSSSPSTSCNIFHYAFLNIEIGLITGLDLGRGDCMDSLKTYFALYQVVLNEMISTIFF